MASMRDRRPTDVWSSSTGPRFSAVVSLAARKPSSRETEEVHLFNAARLYLLAAAEVRSQIDDLDTLNRLGILEQEEPGPAVEEVVARLRKSLEEYEKREQELVRLMEENVDK